MDYTLYLNDQEEDEETEVTVKFTPGWYDPGRISGPPEDCYPPEVEDPDITSVKDEDDVELIAVISATEIEAMVEAATDHQESAAEDHYNGDY